MSEMTFVISVDWTRSVRKVGPQDGHDEEGIDTFEGLHVKRSMAASFCLPHVCRDISSDISGRLRV
jgi:hypothetical protein